MMIIRWRSLLASFIMLLLLGSFGFYLADYYGNMKLAWNPEPVATPTDPGVTPTDPSQVSTESTSNFFAEHRLEREKQRSMQVELLREIINNANTGADIRQQAQQDWLSLTALMEQELTVEKLVMSKGFDDAILVFNNQIANLVVKSPSLTPSEALQITELVSSSLGVGMNKVRVIEHT